MILNLDAFPSLWLAPRERNSKKLNDNFLHVQSLLDSNACTVPEQNNGRRWPHRRGIPKMDQNCDRAFAWSQVWANSHIGHCIQIFPDSIAYTHPAFGNSTQPFGNPHSKKSGLRSIKYLLKNNKEKTNLINKVNSFKVIK